MQSDRRGRSRLCSMRHSVHAAFPLRHGYSKYVVCFIYRLHPFLCDELGGMVAGQSIQLVVVWVQLKHHEIAPRAFELVVEIIWLVSVKVRLGAAQCQKRSNSVRVKECAFDIHLVASCK